MRFCPQCGGARVADEAVCKSCGFALEQLAGAAPSHSKPPEEPTAEAAPGMVAPNSRRPTRKQLLTVGGAIGVIALTVIVSLAVTDWSKGGGESVAHGQTTSFDLDLMPVRYGGRCGFVDRSGKLRINPQFDGAGLFIDGDNLAPVRIGNKWGLINRKGEYVTNPQFDEISVTGRPPVYWVKVGDNWGTITNEGQFSINPQFTHITEFDDEGMAVVAVGGKSGVINRSGDFIIPPQYDWIRVKNRPDGSQQFFSNGLAAARVGDTWGFINRRGEWIVNPQFSGVGFFDEKGLAPASITSTETIDTSQGYVKSTRTINKTVWGYINKTGKFVINPQFEAASDFEGGGLAAVKVGGVYGFVNRLGTFQINPQFNDAESFRGQMAKIGMAITRADGKIEVKFGFISTTGEIVIQPQFVSVGQFDRNDRAPASLGAGFGLIDRTGKFVVNPVYDRIKPIPGKREYLFSKGAIGSQLAEAGWIDKDGRLLATVRGSACHD